MIARYWTARATVEGARAYVEVFKRTLVPQLTRTGRPAHGAQMSPGAIVKARDERKKSR
jgi:hypothetical protein